MTQARSRANAANLYCKKGTDFFELAEMLPSLILTSKRSHVN